MPDAIVTCDRCGRPVHPWPLARGRGCSPAYWANCIRNDEAILEKVRAASVARREREFLREHAAQGKRA